MAKGQRARQKATATERANLIDLKCQEVVRWIDHLIIDVAHGHETNADVDRVQLLKALKALFK